VTREEFSQQQAEEHTQLKSELNELLPLLSSGMIDLQNVHMEIYRTCIWKCLAAPGGKPVRIYSLTLSDGMTFFEVISLDDKFNNMIKEMKVEKYNLVEVKQSQSSGLLDDCRCSLPGFSSWNNTCNILHSYPRSPHHALKHAVVLFDIELNVSCPCGPFPTVIIVNPVPYLSR
jgi:hypothetical protein